MSHQRYVVRNRETGQFIGSKVYSYSAGTLARTTDFEHARLFTRRQDADAAARVHWLEVLPVKVYLHNVQPTGEIIDP